MRKDKVITVNLRTSSPVENCYKNLSQTEDGTWKQDLNREINALTANSLQFRLGRERKEGYMEADRSKEGMDYGMGKSMCFFEGPQREHFKGVLTWVNRNNGHCSLEAKIRL